MIQVIEKYDNANKFVEEKVLPIIENNKDLTYSWTIENQSYYFITDKYDTDYDAAYLSDELNFWIYLYFKCGKGITLTLEEFIKEYS